MSDLLQVVRDEDSHRVQLIGELDASNAESLVQDLAPQLVARTFELVGLEKVDNIELVSSPAN
jgi:anti-anti-sigma regulatory factor